MKKNMFASAILTLTLCFSLSAFGAPKIGAAAPDFTATGHDGTVYKLSDFKDKTVVLEWFNNGCPYVEKHYGSGNMQSLQKTYTEKGVVWLTVASSKKGTEGHLDKAGAVAIAKERKSVQTAILLDEDGKVGKLYGAQTTPHMFVINPKGVLVYQGAIDSNSSSKKSTIKEATNYVVAALDSVAAGKPVTTASTQPYGCSVKY